MNTIQQDVLEVVVYDKNGKFVNELKFTQEVSLKTVKDLSGSTYLNVSNAVQDMNMLELLGELVVNNSSDFEKESFTTPEVKVIRFSNNPDTVKLKLVAKGVDYSLKTSKIEHDIKIIFPNVELVRENNMTFGHGEVQSPTYKFKVLAYDDNENMYEMQFRKRNGDV